jgi:enoyl-CoA hydratase/carnithine racemase
MPDVAPDQGMEPGAGRVTLGREGVIATVVLDNPQRLNALSLAMWRQLGQIFAALSADDSLRCVVLRGAGERAFAAGADIAAFASERDSPEAGRAYAEVTHAALDAVSHCPHPVIARIQGACVGGGLELAACCDMRICGSSARFGIPVKRLGLVCAHAELQALLGSISPAVALEILLEGRVFGAEEAERKGLVTRVVADDALAAEVAAAAARVAEGAPLVARWHKRFVRRLRNPAPLTAAERDEAYACFGTEDYAIGRQAFLAKTRPDFVGR